MLSGHSEIARAETSLFGDPLAFNGVKVFSATMMADRDKLGEKITDWLEQHPGYQIPTWWSPSPATRRSTAWRSPSSTGKSWAAEPARRRPRWRPWRSPAALL
jgi:hypothetical protein